MNVIFVRVRCDDVLIIWKRFLRQLLRQAVCFFRGNVILRVKAMLEVIILTAVIFLRLVEQLRSFSELPRIFAVVVKCVGCDNGGFLLIGDVVDRFCWLGFAATAFE